jgi:hypothetical protein
MAASDRVGGPGRSLSLIVGAHEVSPPVSTDQYSAKVRLSVDNSRNDFQFHRLIERRGQHEAEGVPAPFPINLTGRLTK